MYSRLPHSGAVTVDCTLSVVSHGQGPLVERLIADLSRIGTTRIAALLVTRNLPDDPIQIPPTAGFPVRFIENAQPRGFGANHNAAFAQCSTPWFVVLNPDLRLTEDPFSSMLDAAAPNTGLVAPLVLEPDGRPADSARALVTPLTLARRALASDATHPSPARPDWFAGMFLMLRSAAFAQIGGFDSRYFMYCEDVDLSARLALAGWRLQQVEAAHVVHEARRASRGSARHLRWHLTSLARLWTSRTFWRYRALLRGQTDALAVAGSDAAGTF